MGDNEISKNLFDMLRCPACDERPKVMLRDGWLECDKCGRAYPIRDGRPIMLVEEARIGESK